MASFRDFDPYVLPHVVGAPIPAIDDALLQATIEWCRRTYCVYEEQTVNAPAKPEVLIDSLDDQLDPCAVLEVYTKTMRLTPKTKPQLQLIYPDGWQDETADAPRDLAFWLSLGEATFRLVPYLTVAASKELRVTIAMKPTRTATTLPDLLLSRWPEQIAAGALARLHAHKAGYADPSYVMPFKQTFEREIGIAADEVERGFNRPQLRTGLDVFP